MKALSELTGMDEAMLEKLKKEGIENAEAFNEKLADPSFLEQMGITEEQARVWRREISSKVKPELPPEVRRAFILRRRLDAHRPVFLRSEYFKAQRLGLKWRKPRGKQSKMRLCVYYRPEIVSIGYGSPALARHLHPSGFQEKLVHNTSEVEGIDPKRQAVRIAHGVGSRKRKEIIELCDRLNIRVLNR
jgi:large subunit ribosomal protein L32e